jgi:hypothetical protein
MMHCRLASGPLVVGLLLVSSAFARANEPHALIELFTSQGCSSCPAADKLLGELANDPSVVAISLPIDYWDYLGWKDTLALPGHASRQRAYARVRGDREVYTPQIVVNGATHVLGSDRAAVERAITVTDRNAAVMSVPVVMSVEGGVLNVKITAAGNDRRSGEVWLCPLTRAVAVAIGRGENNGRTVTYTNVVRRWVKIGEFAGGDAAWHVPTTDFMSEGVDAAAVMVQQGVKEKPGVVLGAAYLPIARQTTDSGGKATEAR